MTLAGACLGFFAKCSVPYAGTSRTPATMCGLTSERRWAVLCASSKMPQGRSSELTVLNGDGLIIRRNCGYDISLTRSRRVSQEGGSRLTPTGVALFCRQQGLPGLPWCAGVPVRRACRTGTVPLPVELIEGHGAGGEREPGRDARMPPGSRTGLRDGRAAGRVPADPGAIRAGRQTPARDHRAGRGSGRRPGARERRGGAGRCGPGSPGYRRVRLPGASRPVVPSR